MLRTPHAAAFDVKRQLKRLSRPAGDFDASRYFRGADDLRFHNVGMTAVRAIARAVHAAHRGWSIDDAMRFADILMADPFLEAKAVAIELVARYRRVLTPGWLPHWKRWLSSNQSANWATTDALCGLLIGPVLLQRPGASRQMRTWSRHRNLWVRRASIVSLIPLARRGEALDLVYEVAAALHPDPHDLIHKAVGWALREAGKPDAGRLERYLRANGPRLPRTTVRYAIERFPQSPRRALLAATKQSM